MAVAAFYSRRVWSLLVALTAGFGGACGAADQVEGTAIVLSPQARSNLGLTVKKLMPTTYWRVIELPGVVVDRPGVSDRGVTTPIAGTIVAVHAFPGTTVPPLAPLFTIRLVSDSVHKSQLELFKATREIQIAERQRKRLEELAQSGALAQTRIFDIENQLDRMQATVEAYRKHRRRCRWTVCHRNHCAIASRSRLRSNARCNRYGIGGSPDRKTGVCF